MNNKTCHQTRTYTVLSPPDAYRWGLGWAGLGGAGRGWAAQGEAVFATGAGVARHVATLTSAPCLASARLGRPLPTCTAVVFTLLVAIHDPPLTHLTTNPQHT